MWNNLYSGFINGLGMGSIYALIAIGYTMVYGIARMINFAHGEFITIGAFVSYGTAALIGANPITMVICIIVSMLVCAIVSVITEKLAYYPLRKRNTKKITALITAIGVSYIIYSIFNIRFQEQKGSPKFLNLTDFQLTIITIIITIVTVLLITLFINKTKFGKAMRATSENPSAAKLMGINNDAMISLTFAIGAALAGLGAVVYCLRIPYFKFSVGTEAIGLIPFVAAVVGGIGSLPGAVIGGFIIGIVQQLSMAFPVTSTWTPAIVYGLLILILMIKPTGILGKMVGEKV